MEVEQRRSVTKTKRTIKVRSGIPTGEKLLYLFLVTVVVVGASFVGLRYVQISEYNYQIQTTKKEIRVSQEKSAELQQKIDQMSTRDRIYTEAAVMGMTTTNSDAVKVIGGAQTAKKTTTKTN